MIINAITIANKNHHTLPETACTLNLDTLAVVNKHTPNGGVTNPMAVLTVIMMPK